MSDSTLLKAVAVVGALVGIATIGWTIYKDTRPTPSPQPAIIVVPGPVPAETPQQTPQALKTHELEGNGKSDARVRVPSGTWEVTARANATSSASVGGWMRLSVLAGGSECNFAKVYRNPSDPAELEAVVQCSLTINDGEGNRVIEAQAPNENADAKTVQLVVRLVQAGDGAR